MCCSYSTTQSTILKSVSQTIWIVCLCFTSSSFLFCLLTFLSLSSIVFLTFTFRHFSTFLFFSFSFILCFAFCFFFFFLSFFFFGFTFLFFLFLFSLFLCLFSLFGFFLTFSFRVFTSLNSYHVRHQITDFFQETIRFIHAFVHDIEFSFSLILRSCFCKMFSRSFLRFCFFIVSS